MLEKFRLQLEIFKMFLMVSPVTFGGGYTMIPLIENEVVNKKKWMKGEEMAEIYAVAQSIPGAIAVNAATFIGYRVAGFVGALAAVIGVLLPTFLIVIALCTSLLPYLDNPKIDAAFDGISAAVLALISYAGYKIGRTAIYDKTTLVTVTVAVVVLVCLQISPIIIILAGIVSGILVVKIKDRLGFLSKLEKSDSSTYDNPDYFMGEGI